MLFAGVSDENKFWNFSFVLLSRSAPSVVYCYSPLMPKAALISLGLITVVAALYIPPDKRPDIRFLASGDKC